MNTEWLKQLVESDDPVDLIVDDLKSIWSHDRFAAAEAKGDLDAYVAQGEHEVSAFEEHLWHVFRDIYPLLEAPHARRLKIEQVIGQESFDLVVFDALSWREVPVITGILDERSSEFGVDYARSEVPSETERFCTAHFGVNGPTALKTKAAGNGWNYECVENTNWDPESVGSVRRVTWVRYPDMIFALPPGGVNYDEHVVQPIRAILERILDSSNGRRVVITSDHGYVWMGGGATWALDADEEKLMSQHFKAGRATRNATTNLFGSDKVWISGENAAARGRFAWGSKVAGATKLYKHGGVSLMECLVPWITVEC